MFSKVAKSDSDSESEKSEKPAARPKISFIAPPKSDSEKEEKDDKSNKSEKSVKKARKETSESEKAGSDMDSDGS